MKKLLRHVQLMVLVFAFAAMAKGQTPEIPEANPYGRHEAARTIDKPAAGRMQLVFALDATGSMGGLIATAKQKIWSIAGSMLQADQQTDLMVGFVFYRDRGDVFVTKRIPLTRNLDSAYLYLSDITASGGGDAPESVNQALSEAVGKFAWSDDTSVYKAVFLVGDCPPQMGYNDDIKYPVTCKNAKAADIVINTIRMGNCAGAEQVWKEVARLTDGAYIEVGADASGYVFTTPFDAEIAKRQEKLDDLVLYYGTAELRKVKEGNKMAVKSLNKKASVNEAASRAVYKSESKSLVYYEKDLMNDIGSGKVKLDTMQTRNLPEVLQLLSVAQRTAYLDSVRTERDSAQAQLNVLLRRRAEYVATKTSSEKDKAENSFSYKLYEAVKTQTVKKKIYLKGTVKE